MFKHFTSVTQFTSADMLLEFFDRVRKMEKHWVYGRDLFYVARGKVMVNWFAEPSTRTYVSFESAMARLGGYVITPPAQHSSVVKGETWEDTIKTLSGLCHIIVARTPSEGDADRAAAVSGVPFINAGDGAGEHPTQALLDAYTLWKKFGTLTGLEIGLVGDVKHSRTVHSLLKLLSLFPGVTYRLVTPEGLHMDPREYLHRSDLQVHRHESVDELVETGVNVIYMTRNQSERRTHIRNPNAKEYSYDPRKHHLNLKQVDRLPESSIILHPLPRGNEIAPEVDGNHRAFYFSQQIPNGLRVRMTLLDVMLAEAEKTEK